MKELRSLKRGLPAVKLRRPLKVICQSENIAWPTDRQHQLVQRFFDTCDVKLSRIVGSRDDIDGESKMPEVAFMGRSNVGKSSLLNALLYPRREDKTAMLTRDFARVADHPGYTKTLNFYTCGRQVRVVDMPGYGYGSTSEQGKLIRKYLERQRSLRRVYLLASCKEGITDLDNMSMQILEELGIPWQLVFTKLDKLVSKTEFLDSSRRKEMSDVKKFLGALNSSKPRRNARNMEVLSDEDAHAIEQVVESGLSLIEGNASVFEQVIGTSSAKRLDYLGVPQLRTAIFQACGLLRR